MNANTLREDRLGLMILRLLRSTYRSASRNVTRPLFLAATDQASTPDVAMLFAPHEGAVYIGVSGSARGLAGETAPLRLTISDVVALRPRAKMRRVDARRVVALVHDNFAGRHTTGGLIAGVALELLALAIALPTQLKKGTEELKDNATVIVPVVVDAMKGGERHTDPT